MECTLPHFYCCSFAEITAGTGGPKILFYRPATSGKRHDMVDMKFKPWIVCRAFSTKYAPEIIAFENPYRRPSLILCLSASFGDDALESEGLAEVDCSVFCSSEPLNGGELPLPSALTFLAKACNALFQVFHRVI